MGCCPRGQRQAAAIALWATCSGIARELITHTSNHHCTEARYIGSSDAVIRGQADCLDQVDPLSVVWFWKTTLKDNRRDNLYPRFPPCCLSDCDERARLAAKSCGVDNPLHFSFNVLPHILRYYIRI